MKSKTVAVILAALIFIAGFSAGWIFYLLAGRNSHVDGDTNNGGSVYEHVHAAGNNWQADGENHWNLCACGEILNRSAHGGGTATTENKAVCATCGTEYGELAQSSGTGDTFNDENVGGWN